MIVVIIALFEKTACSQLAQPEWTNVIFTQKSDAQTSSYTPQKRCVEYQHVLCKVLEDEEMLLRLVPPLWWTTSWEAMMWICIIPWHLASLSTHYQCWVSGIFECMRLCVWVCARRIKYPSLTFSLTVHVVQSGCASLDWRLIFFWFLCICGICV